MDEHGHPSFDKFSNAELRKFHIVGTRVLMTVEEAFPAFTQIVKCHCGNRWTIERPAGYIGGTVAFMSGCCVKCIERCSQED